MNIFSIRGPHGVIGVSLTHSKKAKAIIVQEPSGQKRLTFNEDSPEEWLQALVGVLLPEKAMSDGEHSVTGEDEFRITIRNGEPVSILVFSGGMEDAGWFMDDMEDAESVGELLLRLEKNFPSKS